MSCYEDLDPALAGAALHRLGPWDWLIASGAHEGEERTRWSRDQLPDVPLLTLRRTVKSLPHRFTLSHIGDEDIELEWRQLDAGLRRYIQPGHNVLIDMSHLGFERMLYLLPALATTRPGRLGCVYVAPASYAPITAAADGYTLLQAYPIEQPKGYIALSADTTRPNSRHIIVLGFERGRPGKFIDKYDWDDGHLHLIYGDPAFVPDGERSALNSCEPWIDDFQQHHPDHVVTVDARDAGGVAMWLKTQLEQASWLDIVPLGPKSLCLGVLWFYFGLTESDRARVRLLYDFPEPKAPRSLQIGKVLFYDCDRLLTR